MDSKEIRNRFKEYFKNNGHTIVSSDSMVIKGDPSLMFTNAGMNQFKDIFLGIRAAQHLRVVNSQKCLRVSGKHNDIEEVGHDTYHHTMFEMLGNWSFGDYFKEDGIKFAWELLTKEFKIDKDRLYVTVFGGDRADNVKLDSEAETIWQKYVDKDRILYGSKKDNFWEMGDMGPCGPCSEIHVDIRNEEERKKINGKDLVNKDHPQVIEIWNLVFIQYNRKADGSLEILPQKHVDTGMGFERLCCVLQNKKSNYDTDIFQTVINEISTITKIKYGDNPKSDIALRVVADHLRAVAFAVADGQIPSNVKAGYVIRRILRRAVRYYYSFLNIKEALIYKLVNVLANQMGDDYPELKSQQKFIENVIFEEENTFLKTLDKGIKLLEQTIENIKKHNSSIISGKDAFTLYDTYGFPLDLTELIAKEHNLTVDTKEFNIEMQKQKERARNAAEIETDDWIIVNDCESSIFVGYDTNVADIKIVKYRNVKQKNNNVYHLVFDKTPFYAESGGQVGDTGTISNSTETISIENTIKEHNQIIHITKNIPVNTNETFVAKVNEEARQAVEANHTATHLLHESLREVLGKHVEQKGSYVSPNVLRFDFSHFQKMTSEEIRRVERLVNQKVRRNISLCEHRNIPIKEAQNMGAIALFGEKYGETVRVIQFDTSAELCGGTHVKHSGKIGFFKIIVETSIAAGIRRIEAVTAENAETFVEKTLDIQAMLRELFNNVPDVIQSAQKMMEENTVLKKKVEEFTHKQALQLRNILLTQIEDINGIKVIQHIGDFSPEIYKTFVSCFRDKFADTKFIFIGGTVFENKPSLIIILSQPMVNAGFDASKMIREAAKEIDGGGGGQVYLATAGGKNQNGIATAVKKVINYLGMPKI